MDEEPEPRAPAPERIDHTYRDYSRFELTSNFPAKLHAIVSDPKNRDVIRWQPHGRTWKIVDKDLLPTVFGQHFRHANVDSFMRSVNGYGFKRLLKPGPDFKSYYHECFLRGRPELSVLIQRLITPGRKVPDIEGEPDFYEISRLYPLPAPPSDDASQVPSSDGASQEWDPRIVSLSPHHHSQPTSQAGSGAPTSQAGSGASCPQSHHAQPHSTLNGHHAQRTSQAGSGAPTIQAGSGASFPRAQSVTRHSGYCRPPRLLHTVSLLEPGQPYPTQMLQQTYLLNQVRPPLCPPNQPSYG